VEIFACIRFFAFLSCVRPVRWFRDAPDESADAHIVLPADSVKNVRKRVPLMLKISELLSVIGQNCVNSIWSYCDEIPQKLTHLHFSVFFQKLRVNELAGVIDGHKKIQPTFFGIYAININYRVYFR
jgi:hypothetical protein